MLNSLFLSNDYLQNIDPDFKWESYEHIQVAYQILHTYNRQPLDHQILIDFCRKLNTFSKSYFKGCTLHKLAELTLNENSRSLFSIRKMSHETQKAG